MQVQIDSLERQLEQATERDRENRRIIAALTSRIPELPAELPAASSEPREPPEMADDEQQGRGPTPDARGPQEGTERRSWWREFFGFD
jgi:hypothetical protein